MLRVGLHQRTKVLDALPRARRVLQVVRVRRVSQVLAAMVTKPTATEIPINCPNTDHAAAVASTKIMAKVLIKICTTTLVTLTSRTRLTTEDVKKIANRRGLLPKFDVIRNP